MGQPQTTMKQQESKKSYLFDATGKTLGRLATEIAKVLRGKHRTCYTPHLDCGDQVIVINAEKVQVSGNKDKQKLYRHYTGHIGGLREIPYETMLARKPEEIIRRAVAGMVPRNRLGRKQMKSLFIFAGEEHHLQAQKPIQVNI